MTFTVDWVNKIVDSSASITDVIAAHEELRALEGSSLGVLYPAILTYKELSLSGAAKFPAIDFINGYRLRFPNAGNYTIGGGNFNAVIVPVAGVYVERNSSSAYAVTSIGAGGATPEQISDAVWSHSAATSLTSRVVIAQAILQNKTVTNPATGVMTVFAGDGVTPLLTATLFEDVAQTQIYRGQGADVRGALA